MPSRPKKETLPVVVLIGIPNAGKSTLFNRLVGTRRALVTDEPGTTRDRIYARWRVQGKACLVCDTGGVTGRRAEKLQLEIERQTFVAVEEASVVVLVLDGVSGLTAGDLELAARMRPIASRVVVVWNKADSPQRAAGSSEAFALGLGDPIAVSAEHGLGIADLAEAIAEKLPDVQPDSLGPLGEEINVAIVGRPNVGKSSLLNRLCGEQRASVGEAPGTTRDAVDTEIVRNGRLYRFVDTAGIRKPSRASGKIESLGVMTAKRAIERADVALVLFDAAEGLVAQDLTIAGLVEESGRGAVLVANKWDLIEEKEDYVKALGKDLLHRLRFARFAPFVTVSALEGQRVSGLYDNIDRVQEASSITIPTPKLNRFLSGLRSMRASGPRLGYMTQVGVRPPTFLVFGTFGPGAARPHFSEVRRLENRLREEFDIGPTPVRIRYRREGSHKAGARRHVVRRTG